MDPLTILSLVETCAGLSVTAGKLAIGLKTLAGNYQSAAMTFRSLSSQCRLFACAVRAIQQWMDEGPDQGRLDDSTWEQLADSLEVANDAIYALEAELTSTSGGSVNTFWEKVNIVWNQPKLKDLEDCIHKQISSLSVILQIMSLPTFQRQKQGLEDQRSVFQESRSSAITFRDPESSTIRGGDMASTVRQSTIMTSLSKLPTFDFDEMLMASQVYLRNRNKTLALHSTSSRNGKTRDIGVSVSEWDLERQYTTDIDLLEAQKLDKEGLKEWLTHNLLPKHEELQMKYSKVKRYYFEKDAQVTQLQNENKRFLGLGSDGLLAENIALRKQQEWNEKQIQYWQDQCDSRTPSIASANTLVARDGLGMTPT